MGELPLDENGHLQDNWLFIPLDCADRPGGLQVPPPSSRAERKVGLLDVELAQVFGIYDMCPAAVTLGKGTAAEHLHVNIERFVGARDEFEGWLQARQQVEVGWCNYSPDTVKLFWVDSSNGKEIFQASIQVGEPHTHWRQVFMGHKFVLRSTHDKSVVMELVATTNEIRVIGRQGEVDENVKAKVR